MENLELFFYFIGLISCLILLVFEYRISKQNIELRKDLNIVLRYLPASDTAEYVRLVQKYSVKQLNFKEN